jgi:hypothetical protein
MEVHFWKVFWSPPASSVMVPASTAGVEPEIATSRCLVPAFDGAFLSRDWKEALWGKFYTGAPRRQRRSVERYSIVKRA